MEFLAILLLRANETVALDQIVEGLWGECPPRSAVPNIRTYAWQVRRVLGAAADRLVCSPGGYAFLCEDGELDLARFQQLASAGRRALLRGEAEAATRCFREALALWRGTPFCGAQLSRCLQDEVDWLKGIRLTVFESLMDAFLACGAYSEVIEKARRELIYHPLCESLYEKMMTALLESGRGYDALVTYRRARAVMDAELGVAPGTTLRRLYEQTLKEVG